MQAAMIASESVAFHRAREEFRAQPGNSNSITTMMRLALEGFNPHVRHLSSRWLLRMAGVRVVVDEGEDNATASTAKGLCR